MTSLSDSAPSSACGRRRHELLRLHFGELTGDVQFELRTHVDGCAECAGHLVQIEREQVAFQSTNDAAAASVGILARLDAPDASPTIAARWAAGWTAWIRPLVAVAAVALVIALLPISWGPAWGPGSGGFNRTKGGPTLQMYVNSVDGPVRASDGVELEAGDQIQFRYDAAGRRYLLIFSVDGRHAISSLYPAESGPSILIEPTGLHTLDGSVILDDAVGPERVFAIYSDLPIEFADVRAKLEAQRVDGVLSEVDLSWLERAVIVTRTFVKVAP